MQRPGVAYVSIAGCVVNSADKANLPARSEVVNEVRSFFLFEVDDLESRDSSVHLSLQSAAVATTLQLSYSRNERIEDLRCVRSRLVLDH